MRRRAAAGLAVAALALGSATTAAVMAGQDDGSWWPGQHMGRAGPPGPTGFMGHMSHASVDSEHGFLVEMIAHHEEAIDAAGELARSDRSEMRDFGTRIIESQSAQVEQMQDWLDEWYADRPDEVDYDPMMRDLDDLSGDELDETFLTDMIGHHMAAVMMSQQLLMRDLADHAAVDRLAEDIRDEQSREIAMMRRWLRDWFDAGWGMPVSATRRPAPRR
ncbi:DUF305 domain-containing protein [Nocardioides ganghwensis]|uniref:DUF305 domain-containing protein n=1 Tax=Nocardioides ganghwensis TaxID=252230 RepID=A0A4Q2S705_9ACTN|nr:DUF305 domain-containing protein [Nocardioides ganghwensis]MBD3947772.1 DUF305 domain-containing protein [Nocardioides ganghwensis]RYB98100.1 DUF305 domain-containing protein [Nocardioides ganghwensis]